MIELDGKMLEETGLCVDNFHPNSEQSFFPVSICSMALVSHIDLVLTLHALLTSKLFSFKSCVSRGKQNSILACCGKK